ncbi:MAG: ATP-binding cassette domain-containing protein [Planctomycetota bacterium]|nr:ATP-binding cassette domain-containing protein [Planctomycetota bacterium]
MAGSSLIEARAVDLGYGREVVLRGLDLVVERGDFVGILGPNGAGKTTLFRGLLGLVEPLGGRIERGDTRLGYVPQESTFDAAWPVSALEVVALGDRRQGLFGRRARREKALEQLARVGLTERARQRFTSLSGGQRQRVLIARALMAEPDALFLDEPTSGVDLPSQERILRAVTELNADGGPAVLLVAHQLELVARAAQRFLWVAEGRASEVTADDLPGLFHPTPRAAGGEVSHA